MQDFSQEYNVNDLISIVPVGTNFHMNITPRFLYHYTQQSYESFTSLLIKNFAKKSDYFIDVGAHYGYFSLLAKEANKDIKIKAIEPIKENYHILSTNLLPITSKENIINLAISNEKCQKEFHKSLASDNCGFLENPNAETVEKFIVDVENLDNLFSTKIDGSILVKVDTEGNELDVLKGMKKLLMKIEDIKFILEINPKMLILAKSSPEIIFDFLNENNFSIYGIDDNKMNLVKLNNINWKNYFYGQSYFNILAIRKHIESNICFFMHTSNLGGAERSFLDLIKLLVSDGVICSVVMPGEGALKNACQDIGVVVKTIKSMAWWCDISNISDNCFKNIGTTLRDDLSEMVQFVQSISPDAIYSQTIVNPFGAIVAEELNLPHFWALREYGERDHGLNFCFNYKDSMDAMFKTSDYIFSITSSVSEIVLKENYTSEKVKVNYSKVDIPKQYENKEYKPITQQIKIGVFGSIVDGKNQADAISALIVLLKQGYDIELYLVGYWDKEYYSSLMGIIENTNFIEKIKFIGYVDEPIEVMNDMDIVISCAKLEALGRVLIEAILLKIPIIYSNVGGPQEIYTNELHGLSYRLNDEKDLADKIIYTIHNQEKTQKRVDAAYQYILNTFNEKSYATPIIEALKKVKKNSPSRTTNFVTQHVMSRLPLKNLIQTNDAFIQLFIDQGDGFSEENSIKLSVEQNAKSQEFIFDLTDKENLKALRIDPLNDNCVVAIESLHVKTKEGEIDLLPLIQTNALIHHDKSYFFTTEDSQICFDGLNKAILHESQILTVNIHYLHVGEDALRVSVEQSRTELEQSRTELFTIYESKSWKVTRPLRKIKQILQGK